MSWWDSIDVGDHVRANRDLSAGWTDALTGATSVRRGRRGIIRDVHRGWWSTRYTVEFDDGLGTRTVSDVMSSDVRRAAGHGEDLWQTYRALRRGVRLGLFCAFTLPALLALSWYLLQGGTLAELVPALIGEAGTLTVQLISLVADVLGPLLPVAAVCGVLFLLSRAR